MYDVLWVTGGRADPRSGVAGAAEQNLSPRAVGCRMVAEVIAEVPQREVNVAMASRLDELLGDAAEPRGGSAR